MKKKLILIFAVISNGAIAQVNDVASLNTANDIVLSKPLTEESLYAKNSIAIDKGTIFSPRTNYTLIAGKKIVLSSGTLTAPESGYIHRFLIESASPAQSKPQSGQQQKHDKFKTFESLVKKSAAEMLMVEPNPSDGIFNLSFQDGTSGIKSLVVYNCIGKVIYSDSVFGNDKYTLDISDQPAGIYFLRVENVAGELTPSLKIAKQ